MIEAIADVDLVRATEAAHDLNADADWALAMPFFAIVSEMSRRTVRVA